ncbi:MAG: helicase-related protein [Victivallales bacterium]
MANADHSQIAPGARIVVRNVEWLVKKVDATETGGKAIFVTGISEIVKSRDCIFLTDLDKDIEMLTPEQTKLARDTSPGYRNSLLYIESLFRQTPPTDPPSDEKIYLGHKAAMDLVPYQLDPAIKALKQPRCRILIADGTGLGKTMEAGILMTELIRRGRGKRILVVTLKSMLTQFQKEMWSRFSIPLVRLDSVGIQRVRQHIPSNHNPFYHFDRTIISIDTLKQDSEYRPYLENCYWDIIVVDEAHNVAERNGGSLRARLAKLLSSRSDTLIMLSATPHDGRKESFASLMNMLNPTAIANPNDYGPKDIKGLFIRRFKKDIIHQVSSSFQEREVVRARSSASDSEEEIYDIFEKMKFSRIDQKKSGNRLFKTTLEKALFSSPSACAESADNRIGTLKKEIENISDKDQTAGILKDISMLGKLSEKLMSLPKTKFSKYQKLISAIKSSNWSPKATDDRIVIFTERIETLKFLQENLKQDLKLKDDQIEILYGNTDDIDQQRIVEAFGKDDAPVRILIASDIAAEGINLHYNCHRLIHFDIPWSLMVFQQRNGRIDRYGQEKKPQIIYLMTETKNSKIQGDLRILEILTEKDEQAYKNIGDPSVFLKVYDIDLEEEIIAKHIEEGKAPEDLEKQMEKNLKEDPLEILFGSGDDDDEEDDTASYTSAMPTIFADDYAYVKDALAFIGTKREDLQVATDDQAKEIRITVPQDFLPHLKNLPLEVKQKLNANNELILTVDTAKIMREIARCRKEEIAWPDLHLLWDIHPFMEWTNDQIVTAFKRQEAPVLVLQKKLLRNNDAIFLVAGLIANRRSHPIIHRWFGVGLKGAVMDIINLDEILKIIKHGKDQFTNIDKDVDVSKLQTHLVGVVSKATEWMSLNRDEYNETQKPKLEKHLGELASLRKKHFEQLEFEFKDAKSSGVRLSRKEEEKRRIEKEFENYSEWIRETMTTEDKPFIRIAAVLKGI